MLEKLRPKIDPISNKIGAKIAKFNISPTAISIVALVFALISGLYYSKTIFGDVVLGFDSHIIAGIFLLLSGICDLLDGAVARATKTASRKGSFIDSTLDRIAEIFIFSGIILGQYAEPIIVLLSLAASITVSYTRAKAESLQVELKGIGMGERSERLLILIILSFASLIREAMIIIIIISFITIIQRFKSATDRLN